MIASTGFWEVGEVISFDPPLPMGPLGRKSQRGEIIKHNRKLAAIRAKNS